MINFAKQILFFNIKLLWRKPRPNYNRKIEVFKSRDTAHLRKFVENLATGVEWCGNTATHWAEIKTFDLTKAIITSDLALLAFLAAAQNSFENQSIFIFSAVCAVGSSFLLVWFLWSTINKNINNITDREHILRDTMKKISEAADPLPAQIEYEDLLNGAFADLRSHEQIFMPVQRMGMLLFIIAILTALLGLMSIELLWI